MYTNTKQTKMNKIQYKDAIKDYYSEDKPFITKSDNTTDPLDSDDSLREKYMHEPSLEELIDNLFD